MQRAGLASDRAAVTDQVDTETGIPRSVLLIGRSRRVLDGAVNGLCRLGYTAEGTNDFTDVGERFNAAALGVVVFGGQVPVERRAELRKELGSRNPRLIFVQGLAGIPGLIVDQVEGAFSGVAREDPASGRPTYDAVARSIRFRLAGTADVRATAWWQTVFVSDPKSDSIVLIDEELEAGDHEIAIPVAVPRRAAFATVRVGAAVSAFSISDET